MPRFDVSGPTDVDVSFGLGFVEVIASDRTDVVAEVSPNRPGRSGDVSLANDAVVAFEAERLRVTVPRRLNLFGQNDSVQIRVLVPTGSRVAVDTSYGSVRIRGGLGDCRVTAKYGNVNVDTVGGLVLESPHGTVDVAEVTGNLDATLGHGHVRIGRIGGDANVRGSHGTIDLGTTTGAVEVATSGLVTIGRALGDVTARSAHGAIRVREVTNGSIRLENGYANVEVGVPAGVAAWIDAASAHGAVRNELTPDSNAAAVGRSVELRLRANWADVIIHRCTTSSGSTASDSSDSTSGKETSA